MSEADDEYADYLYDCEMDRRLEEGVCLECQGPMPTAPPSPYMRPAKCPKCRPQAWPEQKENPNG